MRAHAAAASQPRGRLWVAFDGRVLQQEVTVFRSRIRFIRLTDEEAAAQVAQLSSNWLADVERKDQRDSDFSLGEFNAAVPGEAASAAADASSPAGFA